MAGVKKFEDSRDTLAYLKTYGKNKDLMVPMTSSLYVPGVMEDTDNVLVEVGASYFIEQSTEKAQDYCKRKHELLQGNARKVNDILAVKKVQMQKVQGELEKRMAAYQAQQQTAN